MRSRHCAWMILLLSIAIAIPAAAWGAEDDWKPLFNGKDLTGWELFNTREGTWKVVDGELVTDGRFGGWLSTADEYADFELELEFRVPPNGNSGVFLRAPHSPGTPSHTALEIQVLDDYGDKYQDLKPYQYTGSIYSTVPASPRVSKPAGEWQTMRILCDKRHVKVTLNGTPVVDANLDDHLDKLTSHPGLARTTGYIGLQNHGSKLTYRNIRIKTLP